jgi:hypothetical protein
MIRKLALAAAALALVTVAIPKASAASETIDLNVDFCSNACFSGASGGTVTKTDVTGGVAIDVELAGTLTFHNTNAFDAFAFNCFGCTGVTVTGFNSTNFTLVTATSSPTCAAPRPNMSPQLCMEDGAALFQYAIADSDGGSSLKFTVGGTNVSLAALDSTNGGKSNVDFAAAVTTNLTSGTNCTGVIGGGDHAASNTTGGLCQSNTSVPEPTAVLLLGTALFFTGKLLKKKLVV